MKRDAVIAIVIIILAVLLVVAFLSYLPMNTDERDEERDYTTLQEYQQAIDYSCQTDSDCMVKDIRNCCGRYDACTNKNSITDADFVDRTCDRENVTSVCGSPDITGCRCVNNRCAKY